jgi:hypothetical protein
MGYNCSEEYVHILTLLALEPFEAGDGVPLFTYRPEGPRTLPAPASRKLIPSRPVLLELPFNATVLALVSFATSCGPSAMFEPED